ncbi:MAG: tRNA (adenosine(37)-N6)-threonylcarbamoyltransferase complex ATPase subunit type 1 TsaE [Solirubrobacteraceae bacterium]
MCALTTPTDPDAAQPAGAPGEYGATARRPAGGPLRGAVLVVETDDRSQSEAFGARIAGMLRPGDVVWLCGELGAGKTTLARGMARAVGVVDPVTSPTFTIAQRYRGEGVSVSHVDLYRVGDIGAEEDDLLADYIDQDSILLVEWPPEASAGANALPAAALSVTIEYLEGERRRIEARFAEEGEA